MKLCYKRLQESMVVEEFKKSSLKSCLTSFAFRYGEREGYGLIPRSSAPEIRVQGLPWG